MIVFSIYGCSTGVFYLNNAMVRIGRQRMIILVRFMEYYELVNTQFQTSNRSSASSLPCDRSLSYVIKRLHI